MERQRVNSNSSKSQGNSQIIVITSWQHAEKCSPTFKRLMMLLLKPKDNHLVETVRIDEERQNEQC